MTRSARTFAGACTLAMLDSCWGPDTPSGMPMAEALRLSTDAQLAFTRADDASNRAVMAGTGQAAVRGATDAKQARQSVSADLGALAPILGGANTRLESGLLSAFQVCYERYQATDDIVLDLAVQKTNANAEDLIFGPGREAADQLEQALDAAVAAEKSTLRCEARAHAATAILAVRKIEVLESPHVAEPSDQRMTLLEAQMSELVASARDNLRAVEELTSPGASESLADAKAALRRFEDTHAKILVLSHKNTDVRSLALALGEKHELTVRCGRAADDLVTAVAARVITPAR